MSITITMPQMGESVVEGVILKWLKGEGDVVARDEPLLEIMTDKVNAELPSLEAGTLVKIIAHEGDTVAVGAPIAELATSEEAAPAPPTRPSPPASMVVAVASAEGRQRRHSPLVRRLAQVHKIDADQIAGTGLDGRVTKADVLAYVARQEHGETAVARARPLTDLPPLPQPVTAPPVAAQPSLTPPAFPLAAGTSSGDTRLPLTPMRKAIAEHMVRSKHEAPHATTVHEVDVTRLVAWREANKAAFRARHGSEITLLSFIAAATCEALREFPMLNSEWGGTEIVLKQQINLGIAVALDQGLIVPVISRADERNTVGLARAIADLARRARENRLSPEEVRDGTFTLTNVGMFGSIMSVPVINQPQAAILAAQAIGKRVVVRPDDSLAVRSMMYLSLSFDHRIVDGMTACRFVQSIAVRLEHMEPEPVG